MKNPRGANALDKVLGKNHIVHQKEIGKEEERKEERNTDTTFLQKMKVLVIALLIGFLGLSTKVLCNPNTNLSKVLCNSQVFSKGDPFAISLAYVLSELEAVTPTGQGYDYYNISPYPNAFAYGHAACNTSLTISDCSTCLGAAKTALFGPCVSRIGGRSVLFDCTIRYEQYPFDD